MRLPAPADTGYGGTGSPYNFGYGEMGVGMGGSLGSLASSFFDRDPYAAGQQYLSQIPGQIGGALNPYRDQGARLMPGVENQFSQMVNNPGDILSRLGSSYQQSPGYQFQRNQALEGANRAYAAGGMNGSSANAVQNMGLANNLANQDYNQYLEHQLGLYGGGLQGLSNLENRGFNANEDYASAMRSYYEQLAQQAEAQQQSQNQRRANQFGGIGSIVGSLAGFLPFGGGS